MSVNTTQLRLTYGEICRGYSKVAYEDRILYIKHFNSFDQTDVDTHYDAVLSETVKRGIQTEAAKLDWLNKKGWWTTEDQAAVDRDKSYIENLERTKSQLPIKSQRDVIDGQLREAQTKRNQMLEKRYRALGKTAESVADQKVQYEYVRLAFFEDATLTKPLFTRAETLQFSEQEADDLISLYVGVIQRFSQENLRRIALQPFFTNYFYICSEDIAAFYGKPIVDLTIQQVNLLSHGIYFKSIFANHNVPPAIAQDPDKVEDFINRAKAGKALVAQAPAQGHRVGYVGAAKEDFEAMGVQDGTAGMRDAAAKGYTNARDAAKDMGVNWTGSG